ncbi:MAG: efflux RND transporter periplasmic adaptor subunit [Verrucomicrobiota bacterium]
MRPILFLPISAIWLLLPACGKKSAAGMPPLPPPAVTFVPAAMETVTITRDLPGRIDAIRVAEIRARVSGILLKKVFEEGADVKAGDVLFQIDPAPLEAIRDSALANLARAEASAKRADQQVNRQRLLVASNAVSKQDADNSESALAVANAEVLVAKAALTTAELNLGYATVTAPISGHIGKAQVTEGALVGQGNATLLAVVQQLDPIYCDFTQTSGDLLALKKAGTAQKPATLLLDDGTAYASAGRVLFSEASVDATTGMVTLRAAFPNPQHELLPGMFARVRVVQAIQENAVTVPQRAVTRAAGGMGSLLLVDDSNHAQVRTVQTGEAIRDRWVITSGLKADERVIMEGHLKAKAGSLVAPAPFVAASQQPDAH